MPVRASRWVQNRTGASHPSNSSAMARLHHAPRCHVARQKVIAWSPYHGWARTAPAHSALLVQAGREDLLQGGRLTLRGAYGAQYKYRVQGFRSLHGEVS
jgi:hypothetical protein